MFKHVETPKGALKYRHPNILEGYEFLSMIEKVEDSRDIFKIKHKFLGMMTDMIYWKELGYASWNEFLADRENMGEAVVAIIDEVFTEITGVFKKKN